MVQNFSEWLNLEWCLSILWSYSSLTKDLIIRCVFMETNLDNKPCNVPLKMWVFDQGEWPHKAHLFYPLQSKLYKGWRMLHLCHTYFDQLRASPPVAISVSLNIYYGWKVDIILGSLLRLLSPITISPFKYGKWMQPSKN